MTQKDQKTQEETIGKAGKDILWEKEPVFSCKNQKFRGKNDGEKQGPCTETRVSAKIDPQ